MTSSSPDQRSAKRRASRHESSGALPPLRILPIRPRCCHRGPTTSAMLSESWDRFASNRRLSALHQKWQQKPQNRKKILKTWENKNLSSLKWKSSELSHAESTYLRDFKSDIPNATEPQQRIFEVTGGLGVGRTSQIPGTEKNQWRIRRTQWRTLWFPRPSLTLGAFPLVHKQHILKEKKQVNRTFKTSYLCLKS